MPDLVFYRTQGTSEILFGRPNEGPTVMICIGFPVRYWSPPTRWSSIIAMKVKKTPSSMWTMAFDPEWEEVAQG
jgi:hypothetical protein